MAGNTTVIDEVVDPVAVKQFQDLATASKAATDSMVAALKVAIELNATTGGSTAATFAKNAKASTDATDKLIKDQQRVIDIEGKKAAAQEAAYNKYLILLSKQQAEREKQDAKEIASAEKKAAKLLQIQQEAEAKAAALITKRKSQDGGTFIGGTGENAPNNNTGVAFSESGLTQQTASVQAITAAQIENATATAGATSEINQETVSYTELQLAIRQNIELQLTLEAELAGVRAEMKLLNTENTQGATKLVTLTALQLELTAAIAQNRSLLNQQNKEYINQQGSATALDASLAQLRLMYSQLSIEQRENVEIGGKMLIEMNLLDAKSKELALSQGLTNKEVGAYEKAIAKATNVSQLAATGVNVLTRSLVRLFVQFLLFSVVFEAVTKLYEYIKALDVFTGRLDKAYQSLLALNEIQKEANKTAGDHLATLEVLYKATTDVSLAEKDRITAAEKLKALYPDKLKGMSDEAIMNGKIADSIDEITKSIEKEALAEASLDKIKAIQSQILDLKVQSDKLNYAKVNESKRAVDAGEDETQASDRSGGGAMSRKDRLAVIKKRTDEQQADIKAQLDVLNNTKNVIEDNAGLGALATAAEKGSKTPKPKKETDQANTDLLEYNRIKLTEAQKTAKLVLDDENQSYTTRKIALDVYLKASRDLIKNSEDILNADTKLRTQQKINKLEELKNKSLDIDREELSENQKIAQTETERLKKYLQDQLLLTKQSEQEQLYELDNGSNAALRILNEGKDATENALTLKYAQGKIKEKEYNDQLLKINDQHNIDRISQELVTQQTILAIKEGNRDVNMSLAKVNGASPDEIAKIKAAGDKDIQPTKDKISGLNDDLGNAFATQGIHNSKSDAEKAKEIADKKKKILEQSLDDAIQITTVIDSAIDKSYENQISKLEQIGKKVEENAQIEKDAVNNSLDTNTNKARRLSIIDAQTASQQKAIQAQINAEKTKQAKADKAAAIANIIFTTAKNVVGAFPIVPLEILAAVLGATQLAAAIAAPLPTYFKGTGTGAHPGGLAVYGELGRELVEEPGRLPYYSPGVATITNLPKGTKITPHNMLPETPKWTESRTDNRDIVDAVKEVSKEVRRNQQTQKQPKLTGWVAAQRQADAWASYSTNHFR